MIKLTIEEYNKKCDKIFKSNLQVHEILIAFLDFEASVEIIKEKNENNH